MQYANYMIKGLRILSHDVETWRSMKAAERTTKWLKDRIRYRIETWRAKNCSKAANAAFESAVASGYSALPAEGKGSYRNPPANQDLGWERQRDHRRL